MVQINSKLHIVLSFIALLFEGCMDFQDTFRRKKLVSSKGEELFINTLNWGVTDDNQYAIVTKDASRLKNRTDTVDVLHGPSPFVYRFRGDTLALFYLESKAIDIKETFKSISIDYNPLENSEYMDIIYKAGKGEEGYQLIS